MHTQWRPVANKWQYTMYRYMRRATEPRLTAAADGGAVADGDDGTLPESSEVAQLELPPVYLLRHAAVENTVRSEITSTFQGSITLRIHATLGIEANCFTGPWAERVTRILVRPEPGGALPTVAAPVLGLVVKKLLACVHLPNEHTYPVPFAPRVAVRLLWTTLAPRRTHHRRHHRKRRPPITSVICCVTSQPLPWPVLAET